ncbi:uncharacterized protein [Musca autumnalis]|uniref:uncharacterized protein n=1 Tax=Musca autumnalis TaxID=221902 RepID=UPI003CF48929
MQPATGAKPKTYGIMTRSTSQAVGEAAGTEPGTGSGIPASADGNDPPTPNEFASPPTLSQVNEQLSTIPRPSFSPLTIRGNDEDQVDRLSSTGVLEVVQSALEATQASMVETMKKEMQKAVAAAVQAAFSQSSVPPANPINRQEPHSQSIDWPHDLPPLQTDTRQAGSGSRNQEVPNRNREDFSRPRYPYLSKWGIKFDATPKTPNVEDFIFRVERLRNSYGCPEQELVDEFHHLLEGRPCQWYWGLIRQYPNLNWEMLKLCIVREFQRFQSNLDVMRQIMDRKQGRDESATQYIDAINSLRTQLREPLKDFEVIDILKAGLKPRLAHLTFSGTFYSVEQFRNEVRKAEEFLERESSLRFRTGQPPRMINEINDSDFDDLVHDVEELRFRPKAPGVSKNETSRCWNCGSNGHIVKNCTSSHRSVFCFRCGSPGVTTPQCNNCKQISRPANVSKSESIATQTVD